MKRFILFTVLSINSLLFSQVTPDYQFIEEYEFNLGYINLQGDMGKPSDFFAGYGSSGGAIGTKFYMNFADPEDNTRTYFGRHLKYNFDIALGYIKIVNEKGSGLDAEYSSKLNAVYGDFYWSKLALNIEYHLTDLRRNIFFKSKFFTHFDPYIGGGLFASYSNVTIKSALGDYTKDVDILPHPYQGRIKNGSFVYAGLQYIIGLRYKFSDQFQLSIWNEWIYYNSDYVDGLNPNPNLSLNIHNDWMFRLNTGLIFYLKKKYK